MYPRSIKAALCAGLSIISTVVTAQVISVTPTTIYATSGQSVSVPIVYKASSATNQGQGNFVLDINGGTGGPLPGTPIVAGMASESMTGVYPTCLFANNFTTNGAVTWFDIANSGFPNLPGCGSQTADFTIATYVGTATTFTAGKISIPVRGQTAGTTTSLTVNVCQKTTVTSIVSSIATVEGSTGTYDINFAAVPVGCGGFAIPVSLSGAAVAGKGATISGNTCTSVADAATKCTVTISTTDNATLDGDMQATLTVTDSTASSNYVSSGNTASLLVADNEVGVSVVATVASASEAGPVNGVVTFARTGLTLAAQAITSTISGSALPAAGNFSFTAGTCSAVSYAAPTLSATIPAGSANCTVNIVPVDDSVVEGPQTVVVQVPTGTGAVGTGSNATVTIADNDSAPIFSVAKAGACAEAVAPTNCTFSITRDSGVSTATTLNFTVTGTATRGTDYVLKTGGCAAGTALTANMVSHPDGNPLTIDVCPLDDLFVETGGETVILTLTPNAPTYTVGTATQTQTIADDDSAQVIFVSGGGLLAEAGGTATITYTRTGGSAAALAAPLTVNIARSGTATFGAACSAGVDYTASPSGTTLTFPAAANTVDVTVTACQDTVVDPAETITYAIAAPTVATDYTVGTPTSATATITDDEMAVVVTPLSVTEGGTATFTVSCSTLGGSVTGLTFAVTGADAGQNPTPAGPALGTLTCGTPIVVSIPTLDDTTIGNGRQLTFTLTGPATGSTGGTVVFPATTIASVSDNDQPLVVPTLGALGLGLMSLLLAGMVGLQRRRGTK